MDYLGKPRVRNSFRPRTFASARTRITRSQLRRKRSAPPVPRLIPVDREKAQAMRDEGMVLREIAEHFRVHLSRIHAITTNPKKR
jgi:hypothetical protein